MKKLFLLLIFAGSLSTPFRGTSNPIYIPPPQVFISELSFTSAVDWTLELEMYISPYDTSWLSASTFDSIVIQTNAGRTRLLSFPIASYQLFVLTPANLSNLLGINPVQDTIRVITYINPNVFLYGSPYINTHMLVYGYSGCEIPVLQYGQSACTRKSQDTPLYFYLDNSPTIGVENDTIGASFSVYGRFYDCRDSLITYVLPQHEFSMQINTESTLLLGWWYYHSLFHFIFDSQGLYHTQLLSRMSTIQGVRYLDYEYCPSGAPYCAYLPCESSTFFLEPGGAQYLDIHLTDDTFLVGLANDRQRNTKPITVICGPNPVDYTGIFYISSDQPVEDASILVFSLNGKQVMHLDIPHETKSELEFTRDQLGKSGIYIYSVMQKGRKVGSGQIICR